MQGSQSSATTLPEIVNLDNDSGASGAGIESALPWNAMPITAQNPLLSSATHSLYPQQHVRREIRMAEWYIGETSSNVCPHGPYGIVSSENSGIINPSVERATIMPFLLPNSSIPSTVTVPQDLNMFMEFQDQEDNNNNDDCFVIGSSNGGNAIDGSNDRSGSSSSDGRRMPCKRKALEMETGPSSGSSIFLQNTEIRHWNTIPENNICTTTLVTPENNTITNNVPQHANNELRLGVGQSFSPSLFSSTALVNDEISHRNFHLRIHGLRQQDPILPEHPFLSDLTNVGNMNSSSSSIHGSREGLPNPLLELNPSPMLENRGLHQQSTLLDVPTVHRSHQSSWSGSLSARSTRSSAALYEESTHRTIPRRLSEHPILVPAGDTGNLSQFHMNWNFSGVDSNTNSIDNSPTAGNATSASRAGSARGERLLAFGGSHRSFPQYQRGLSEIVMRSLLSEQSVVNNHVGRSQEMASPAGLDSNDNNTNNNVGRHVPILRSGLLERHLDGGGASRVPHSWSSLSAASSEGRSRSIMSEHVRHVLDLMRRGEGLRFEDAMILDHSILSRMADIHDRHRDMRLDVDSMSYEELLALEERIGNVCTGLSEETILTRLKQRKFVDFKVGYGDETELCSICREEYNNGEDLGTLECGHDFHKDCIKQWLVQKNLCPICKMTGLKNI